MMGAFIQQGLMAAAHCAPLRFADCQQCGKLTLQMGGSPCQDRHACHGVIIDIRAVAETERGAVAIKPAV